MAYTPGPYSVPPITRCTWCDEPFDGRAPQVTYGDPATAAYCSVGCAEAHDEDLAHVLADALLGPVALMGGVK